MKPQKTPNNRSNHKKKNNNKVEISQFLTLNCTINLQ